MRKIAIGASVLPYDSADAYNNFTSTMGRAPALWSVWSDWAGGNNPNAFPTAMVQTLHAGGTVPVIFWQPVGPGNSPDTGIPLEDTCGVSYDKITGNAHANPPVVAGWDSYIRGWADAARAASGRILVRFAHEMDGSWFPFGYNRCTNTATKFKKLWKYVVTIFRQEGATNVKFVWSPVSATRAKMNLYPGTSWVDYVGFTFFNWATSRNLPWLSLAAGVKRVTNGLSTYAGDKPWILAETGSVVVAGHSRPAWLTKGYDAVYAQFPKVKAIMYFDIDMTKQSFNQPNWELNRKVDTDAYRAIVADGRFKGKVN